MTTFTLLFLGLLLPESMKMSWRHSCCIIGDKLFILGGGSQNLSIYNFKTGLTNSTRELLPYPVFSGSIVVWGDKILFSGGMRNDMKISDDVFCVSPDESAGSQTLEIMKFKLVPRFGHTSHIIGRDLCGVI